MASDDEYVPVDYDEQVTSTPLAKCYRIDGEKVWFPKSVHEHDDDPQRPVIWVQEWFAEKEGLV